MNDLTISIQDQLPKESIKMIGNQLGATEAQTELAIETINAVVIALMAQKVSVVQASSSMLKVLDRNKDGNYGAACHGIDTFPFSVYSPQSKQVKIEKRDCLRSI